MVCADNLLTGRLENLKQLSHEPCFEFVEQGVCKAFDPGGVDYIFHFASAASPAGYLKHGIETLQAGSAGTMNCLQLAKKYKAKFLLASTSEAVRGSSHDDLLPQSACGHAYCAHL